MRYATVMFLLAYYYVTIGLEDWPAFGAIVLAEVATVLCYLLWDGIQIADEQLND